MKKGLATSEVSGAPKTSMRVSMAAAELAERLRALDGTRRVGGNDGVTLGAVEVVVDRRTELHRIRSISESISRWAEGELE